MDDRSKCLPAPYKRRRYYISKDVKAHNTAHDCWVSFFGGVYDLSNLIFEHRQDPLIEPIIAAAGTDITHWFDPETQDPKTCVYEPTGLVGVYCPQGRFLHVPSINPDANFDSSFEIPWWNDKEKYLIGSLTIKTRKIKIMNMLSKQEDIIKVACEESMNEILDRYLPLNSHAASYTWKRLRQPLDMDLNLEENGIEDETDEYKELNIEPDSYIPIVHLYYNDDLTVK